MYSIESGNCTVSVFIASREQLEAIKKQLHLNLNTNTTSCAQRDEVGSAGSGLTPSAAAAKEGLEYGVDYFEVVGGTLEASLFFQKNTAARYAVAFYFAAVANNSSQGLPFADPMQVLLYYRADYTYGRSQSQLN